MPRVGFPDPDTFRAAYLALASFHDALWAATGIAPGKTILGGFSMGSVMSYALALGEDRPAPAGILAFSGFIPTVDRWKPCFGDRRDMHVFIAHGRNDAVISVEFARRARSLLTTAGLDVEYHESEGEHYIDSDHARDAASWLGRALQAPCG